MSPLLSGNEGGGDLWSNETSLRNHEFPISDVSQIGEARRFSQHLGASLGLNEQALGRLAIIVTELGTNLLRHATKGFILLGVNRDSKFVEVHAIDSGPGIDNISLSLEDGFSTSTTPGTGLGAIRRQASEFDIFSQYLKGTVIWATVGNSTRALSASPSPRFQLGAICIPIRGETVSGDGWSKSIVKDRLSILVADGLGHGPLAHKAAAEAILAFQESANSPTSGQIKDIHRRLKSTRGAAVFALRIDADDGKIHFCGLGNIRAAVLSETGSRVLLSQNGTAGLQMRDARELTESWPRKGLLVIHSDGITGRWNLDQYPGIKVRHAGIIAGVIYRDFCRGSDDSTVVVGKEL